MQSRHRLSQCLGYNERVNLEIKRRTRVARLFPNEASRLRRVTALLAEISEKWEPGGIYLNLETSPQPSV
jgi:transposase-like protein